MATHNADNERIKRRCFAYLKNAKRHSERDRVLDRRRTGQSRHREGEGAERDGSGIRRLGISERSNGIAMG
jgi:hypothetical protein